MFLNNPDVCGEYILREVNISKYSIPFSSFKNIDYPESIDTDIQWSSINILNPSNKKYISSSLLPISKTRDKHNYDLICAFQKDLLDDTIIRVGVFLNIRENSITILSSTNYSFENMKSPYSYTQKQGWYVNKKISAPLNFWITITNYCNKNS
jgi:hypothetical protein